MQKLLSYLPLLASYPGWWLSRVDCSLLFKYLRVHGIGVKKLELYLTMIAQQLVAMLVQMQHFSIKTFKTNC
jgi:hypothetical protein